MNKITKKTIKRIKAGYHDDLMDAIEFLIDSHNEDKFDAGYKSCMKDMGVRSYQLAEFIKSSAPIVGHKPCKGESVSVVEIDDLAKLIENYFTEILKKD